MKKINRKYYKNEENESPSRPYKFTKRLTEQSDFLPG